MSEPTAKEQWEFVLLVGLWILRLTAAMYGAAFIIRWVVSLV